VAPAAFHAALRPLLTHRRQQGFRVELIDVAAIYDVWSYGPNLAMSLDVAWSIVCGVVPYPVAALTRVTYYSGICCFEESLGWNATLPQLRPMRGTNGRHDGSSIFALRRVAHCGRLCA
jgi:hypothetical protein